MASQLDDDDFDWEAAVQEIDIACQGVASTSNVAGFDNLIPSETLEGKKSCSGIKKSGGARQSTLDNYVETKRLCGVIHDARAGISPFSHAGDVCGGIEESLRGNQSVSNRGEIDLVEDETVCNKINLEAAKTWIYPVNVPLRDYQLNITKTALFSNTLVALPTGLGKTLIAAVVMYNYFRWFPEGKIVFTAPSRPLVLQQIEACHNIVGIPQEWTIDMTGLMSPSKRSHFWKAKRVFFVTPQVLEKDIQSGTCLVKQLVCLVIDEAHRAMGNYSYCMAVRELMAVPVQLRILALTATPGSKQMTIQGVIDNLYISTLEYRNESHHDVSPYVHNRKLELIEVKMGKEATRINNLLLEAIQPFVTRLCTMGVLYKRDFATLSPCELLTSRDKFRQAPPLSLPHTKYGEVEGCFAVLITLYHIRKLLSSHGLRPAYEMLEEKLQQGSFARLTSKNETILQAKLLMLQSLSHGAPNPKLVKMIDVLINHFKTKDPKESRVIIFSNFRGSVKDIMDTLSNIGDLVKATQFIGQSSGKSSKGQSQKVQQEVLQKFRSGGYNVIVATSIGEEGLDIMEVDLVICFDANISPLRMIQRMGRTGRKHDGRVVVLACEGSELRGYLKKQANSKAVGKHMHNGGTNSFNFHSSPRMVPHICKPEVQFVELSIKQFVPRGKKVKEDPTHKLIFANKISDAENDTIMKYFPCGEDLWRPSLIAFPHFQAFPSRVHKVRHSLRTTGMLIETVHCLQELSSFKADQILSVKVKSSLEGATVVKDEDIDGDANDNAHIAFTQSKREDVKASARETSGGKDGISLVDIQSQKSLVHCFLFGADFISVDTTGRVSIAYVPVFPFSKAAPTWKSISPNSTMLPKNMQDTSPLRKSPGINDELCAQPKASEELADFTEAERLNKCPLNLLSPKADANQVQALHMIEELVPETPTSKGKQLDSADHTIGTPAHTEEKSKTSLAIESRGELEDIKLSPRLTNFIEKGIVPESPILDFYHHSSVTGYIEHDRCELRTECPSKSTHEKMSPKGKKHLGELFNSSAKNDSIPPAHLLPDIPKFFSGTYSKALPTENMERVSVDIDLGKDYISKSPARWEIHTPLVNRTNNTSSEDWQMSSEEASKSIQQKPKLKRLRKFGDRGKRLPVKSLKGENMGTKSDDNRPSAVNNLSVVKYATGKQKFTTHAKTFIEEEAEVSEDGEVSDDEEDDKDDEYDGSFIDDRVDPTAATTTEASGCDMMAFYRRSLLTQSPMMHQPNYSIDSSHESASPRTDERENSTSVNMNHSPWTPANGLHSAHQSTGRNSVSYVSDNGKVPRIDTTGESSVLLRGDESRTDSRKRKLSFQQVDSIPTLSFGQEHLFHSKINGEASIHSQPVHNDLNIDVFYDDQFYEGLDLDAMEAQATKLLRYKSKLSIQNKQGNISNLSAEIEEDISPTALNSPSFYLGI